MTDYGESFARGRATPALRLAGDAPQNFHLPSRRAPATHQQRPEKITPPIASEILAKGGTAQIAAGPDKLALRLGMLRSTHDHALLPEDYELRAETERLKSRVQQSLQSEDSASPQEGIEA